MKQQKNQKVCDLRIYNTAYHSAIRKGKISNFGNFMWIIPFTFKSELPSFKCHLQISTVPKSFKNE